MAHIRRNFFDLMKAHNSPIATEAVQRIAALYLIEKQIKGRPADQRRAMRTSGRRGDRYRGSPDHCHAPPPQG
jgi:transposase